MDSTRTHGITIGADRRCFIRASALACGAITRARCFETAPRATTRSRLAGAASRRFGSTSSALPPMSGREVFVPAVVLLKADLGRLQQRANLVLNRDLGLPDQDQEKWRPAGSNARPLGSHAIR